MVNRHPRLVRALRPARALLLWGLVLLPACGAEQGLQEELSAHEKGLTVSETAVQNLLDLYEEGILDRNVDLLDRLFSDAYLDADGKGKMARLAEWSLDLERPYFLLIRDSLWFNLPRHFRLTGREIRIEEDEATVYCREESQWVNTVSDLRETRSARLRLRARREPQALGTGWRITAIDRLGGSGRVWSDEYWTADMRPGQPGQARLMVTAEAYDASGAPIAKGGRVRSPAGTWFPLEPCSPPAGQTRISTPPTCGRGYCVQHAIDCLATLTDGADRLRCLERGCSGTDIDVPGRPGLGTLEVEIEGAEGMPQTVVHRYQVADWSIHDWEVFHLLGGRGSDNLVASLCRGARGALWVGTQARGRVYRYAPGRAEPELILDLDGGLYEVFPNLYAVQAMTTDTQGNLWVGVSGIRNAENTPIARETAEILRFDGEHWTTFPMSAFAEGMSSTVLCAVSDGRGGVWFGGRGVWHWNGRTFDACYTREDGLGAKEVNCLLLDEEGRLWCGTSVGGVSRLEGTRWSTFTFSPHTPAQVDDLESLVDEVLQAIFYKEPIDKIPELDPQRIGDVAKEDMVWSATRDHLGRLWFGTYGGGVRVFRGGDPADPARWDHITSENTASASREGLASNIVMSIGADPWNRIWFGTPDAINCLDDKGTPETSDDTWRTYRLEQFNNLGLYTGPALTSSTRAVTFDGEGTPWFGTFLGGLLHFRSPP